MKEHIKFSLQLAVFATVFSAVCYFKFSRRFALIFFAIVFSLAILSLICKPFALKFKSGLEKTGSFIGEKLAIIVLFFVYIIAVLPTKAMMFLTKRDRLKLKNTKEESYWQACENTKTNYELQY